MKILLNDLGCNLSCLGLLLFLHSSSDLLSLRLLLREQFRILCLQFLIGLSLLLLSICSLFLLMSSLSFLLGLLHFDFTLHLDLIHLDAGIFTDRLLLTDDLLLLLRGEGDVVVVVVVSVLVVDVLV